MGSSPMGGGMNGCISGGMSGGVSGGVGGGVGGGGAVDGSASAADEVVPPIARTSCFIHDISPLLRAAEVLQ